MSNTTRTPKRKRKGAANRAPAKARDGFMDKSTFSMTPFDWALLDRECQPPPWYGNRSAWLRDTLRRRNDKRLNGNQRTRTADLANA